MDSEVMRMMIACGRVKKHLPRWTMPIGAVDGVPEEQLLDEPLGAEEVDPARCRAAATATRIGIIVIDWNRPLERDAAPGERVGEGETRWRR